MDAVRARLARGAGDVETALGELLENHERMNQVIEYCQGQYDTAAKAEAFETTAEYARQGLEAVAGHINMLRVALVLS